MSVEWPSFQVLFWLPDRKLSDMAPELIYDYVLLFIMSRQQRVYHIEKAFNESKKPFPGGSNRTILKNIENRNQIPPEQSHDFATTTKY